MYVILRNVPQSEDLAMKRFSYNVHDIIVFN